MSPVLLYGAAIQQATATGDLVTMKKMASQAEEHLLAHGDVRAALDALKVEIAKLETK